MHPFVQPSCCRSLRGRFAIALIGGIALSGALWAPPVRAQPFETIHSFAVLPDLAFIPKAPVTVVGTKVYGTTETGSAGGNGAIFSMDRDGANYQILHGFGPSPLDGHTPSSGLLNVGSKLYGTTLAGGSFGGGILFSLDTNNSVFQVLHHFDRPGGEYPLSDLILVGSALVGTTQRRGAGSRGTIYSIGLDGTGFQTWHDFGTIDDDGANPQSGVTLVGDTLYGATLSGGEVNQGAIYAMDPGGANYRVLHSFNNQDGSRPLGDLVLVGDRLYGTANGGGEFNWGTIFSIGVDGTGFEVLHSFDTPDGVAPFAGLTVADGRLYGVTSQGGTVGATGTLFAIDPDGSDFRVVHHLIGDDGRGPEAELFYDGEFLYGTSVLGGSLARGNVFRIAIPETSSIVQSAIGCLILAGAALRWRRSPLRRAA